MGNSRPDWLEATPRGRPSETSYMSGILSQQFPPGRQRALVTAATTASPLSVPVLTILKTGQTLRPPPPAVATPRSAVVNPRRWTKPTSHPPARVLRQNG